MRINLVRNKIFGNERKTTVGELVSVILPAHNAAAFLAQSVASVLSQSYADFELIIIDDASTDDTCTLLEGFAGHPKIKIIRCQCMSCGKARNIGLGLAKGSFVAFIDADDVWLPGKLSRQVQVLLDDPAAGWNYANCYVADKDLRPVYLISRRGPMPQGIIYNKLLTMHPEIRPSGVLIRKEVIDECGFFDPEIQGVEDWEFFLRVARKFRCVYIKEPLFKYRKHDNNVTKQAALMETGYGCALAKLLPLHKELEGVLLGNYHRVIGASWLLGGNQVRGRRHYLKAVRYRPADLLSWAGLLVSILPPWIARILIGFKKRFIKRSFS
jgi:glycosyltransferase involved in cell wall biosynthesis